MTRYKPSRELEWVLGKKTLENEILKDVVDLAPQWNQSLKNEVLIMNYRHQQSQNNSK